MKNYQCKRCRIVIQSGSFPNSTGCPEGSSHAWKDLGKLGIVNYQCKRCGTLIQSKSFPNSIGCPDGSSHSWNKL